MGENKKTANDGKKKGKFTEPATKNLAPSLAQLEGKKAFSIQEIDEVVVEQYLIAHPVIAQGIDKKCNRIINRGYDIVGGKEEYRKHLKTVLERSGGEILIKNWVKDAYGFGNGWLYLVPAAGEGSTEVVKISQKHPVFFGFLKEKKKGSGLWGEDKWQIVFEGDKPKGYSEYLLKDSQRIPKPGSNIGLDKVAHLKFDTWGDELEGTGIVQYAHLVIKYLLNIEEAGAEAMYRNGFIQKVFSTNLTSEKALKEFGKKVRNANDTDAIVLSRDTTCTNLMPGKTDFVDFHEEFLKLISIPLGLPRPLLTMDGTDTNKSTLGAIKDEMYEDFYADELVIKRTLDEQVFKPIVLSKWEGAKNEDIPKFIFNRRPKDINDELEKKNREGDVLFKVAQAAKHMFDMGMEDRAKRVIERFLDDSDGLDIVRDEEAGIRSLFEKKIDYDEDKSRGTFTEQETK